MWSSMKRSDGCCHRVGLPLFCWSTLDEFDAIFDAFVRIYHDDFPKWRFCTEPGSCDVRNRPNPTNCHHVLSLVQCRGASSCSNRWPVDFLLRSKLLHQAGLESIFCFPGSGATPYTTGAVLPHVTFLFSATCHRRSRKRLDYICCGKEATNTLRRDCRGSVNSCCTHSRVFFTFPIFSNAALWLQSND